MRSETTALSGWATLSAGLLAILFLPAPTWAHVSMNFTAENPKNGADIVGKHTSFLRAVHARTGLSLKGVSDSADHGAQESAIARTTFVSGEPDSGR